LPKLPTNFVGRAKDLVEIVRLFEREKTPRVCVYGPGGIGKTEFAKLVASWMRVKYMHLPISCSGPWPRLYRIMDHSRRGRD
jgi:replication-associated recombination protein RarA